MTSFGEKVELIKSCIKNYPDFPKSGVLFRDIFSVMANPTAAEALRDILIYYCSEYISTFDAVCALESRGFIFGPLIALHFKVPFVPIRKKGKLPGEVKTVSYNLEYGSDAFEIQCDALTPGSKVLLVDDLIAVGGSLSGACELIKSVGCSVENCLVVIELEELKGREKVPSPVHSMIKL